MPAEAPVISASSSYDGAYLIYTTGDETTETVAFSYSFKDDESEEILDGEDVRFIHGPRGDYFILADVSEDGDAAQFYGVRWDGSGVNELAEFDFDDYSIGDIYYMQNSNDIFFTLMNEDGESSIYFMQLDEEDEGFFVLEEVFVPGRRCREEFFLPIPGLF